MCHMRIYVNTLVIFLYYCRGAARRFAVMAQVDGASSIDEALASFNKICDSTSLQEVQQLFKSLSREVGVDFDQHGMFYPALKAKLSSSWKFSELCALYDKRVTANEYAQQTACNGMRCLVIGAGPVGLRTAVEAALLGAKVDVVEKREGYSRNNVLHLWPFLITDLRNLGAKKFYGKFCSGDLDHISRCWSTQAFVATCGSCACTRVGWVRCQLASGAGHPWSMLRVVGTTCSTCTCCPFIIGMATNRV